MKLVTAEEMFNADREMFEKFDVPTLLLMEHAAQSLFEVIKEKNLLSKKILIICGKGNNGGDGYALARLLSLSGADVKIHNAFSIVPRGNDAEINYKICRRMGITFVDNTYVGTAEVIIDAIFGTGMNDSLNEFCVDLISRINKSKAIKISVDLPSGAYGNATLQQNVTVNSDFTVTFGAFKPAHIFYPSKEACGEVIVKDIGIFDECIKTDKTMIDTDLLKTLIPKRIPYGHKGTFGKLSIIAGAKGYSGAAYMCSQSALRSGVGTIKLYVPSSISQALEEKTCEVMTYPLEEDGTGAISISSTSEIVSAGINSSAVLFGPGLSRTDGIKNILHTLITTTTAPVVIDADGLYALSLDIDMLEDATCPIVLTPHLVEMARLSGDSVEDLKNDPILTSTRFARAKGVTVVMKSATTVVATPDGESYICEGSNSGMAKGGSGDVLSGIIASLCAQGILPETASVIGVGIHSKAGKIALSKVGSEYSMLPTDVISSIGLAFKEM